MNKNRKLKRTDKKIKKKQLQQTKEKLSKLSTKELMDKRKGINPKSESKADYIKRRKGEMNKPSPAKLPFLAALVTKIGAAAKGIKAGAALAKGAKAVGTAQKIGKAAKIASKAVGTAKSVINQTGGTPPAQGGAKSQSLQKFASMDFKSSPNKLVGPGPSPFKPQPADTRKKNFDTASAFKMKGFSGFGETVASASAGGLMKRNLKAKTSEMMPLQKEYLQKLKVKTKTGPDNKKRKSPAKLGVAKIAVKAGVKAGKAIKKAYQNYKGTAVDPKLKAATGYARKVDLQKANARLKANKNRR